jgi:hypothetical protein
MIQQPRWMCYDQQLTVVKQICKEFVKVTIQWNWLVISWIGLLSSSSYLHLKYWITILSIGWFSGPSPYSFHFVVGLQQMVKQKYKNVPRKTIHQTENKYLDIMVNQYFRWRCELLDNRPIQGEFSKDGWKWWKMWDGYYDLYCEMIQLPRWICYFINRLVLWSITVFISFCGWSSANGETKIQECAKKDNTSNRK